MTIRSYDTIYVDGRWIPSTGADTIDVISPHTEETIASVPDGTPADMDGAVGAARRAFDTGDWPRVPVAERIATLERAAAAYEKRLPEMAATITAENGSPISFSQAAQAPGGWAMLLTCAQIAAGFEWEATRAGVVCPEVIVRHEPVGVVAAVVPWNVPQLAIMTKLAPALLAGCTVVLKPSPETPLDAYLLFEVLEEAGLPPGVVNVVPAGRDTGQHLVSHPGVDKVAFTGSTAAGRTIGRICGEQLKRCSLELGGKSAAIILDDADLPATMEGLKFAAVLNSGQACTNQTRILASRRSYDSVVDAMVETMRSMHLGDPLDPTTEIGPMVSQSHQARVEKYIAIGQEEGATVAYGGGGQPAGFDTGWYVQPTVFANAHNDMRICREEIFGPVVTVIPYDDVDDAVRIANDSEYGLAGSVWTTDLDTGHTIARRIRTGTFGINNYTVDLMAPAGGYKASGIGRELGPEGLAGYTETKAIYPPAVEGQTFLVASD